MEDDVDIHSDWFQASIPCLQFFPGLPCSTSVNTKRYHNNYEKNKKDQLVKRREIKADAEQAIKNLNFG